MGPGESSGKSQGLGHHPNSLTASLSVICLFSGFLSCKSLGLDGALLGVVCDGPLGAFCCGEQGDALALSQLGSVCPHRLSPHLHPAAGAPGQGEMLGVEMGAVTVVTVRNKE